MEIKGNILPANIEHEDAVEDIISLKPPLLVRYGTSIFFVILVLLISATWFIRYPDIIPASAVLTGYNAPKEIIPKQTGRLTALFAQNNQKVKQGDILGWIESNADTKVIVELSARLDSSIKMLGNGKPRSIAGLFNRRLNNLGELQTAYQTFISALQLYNDYLINGFYSRRKQFLNDDIASLQIMKSRTAQQKDFTSKDNELAKKTFEMNETLYKEKVISLEEYRRAQSTLLNKQKADPQMDISIISQQNQIRDKQKEIDQLNHDVIQQQQTFEQALQTLKSKVDEWLLQYTIQAPTDGTIVFALPLQQHQFIAQGKLLGYVNPNDSKYFAEIRLSQNNFGKVDTGMKVQLRFNAYPYQETGFVSGKLSYLSNVAIDSGFVGTIQLDNGLITNLNKPLQYKNGLKAQALVVTKEMRLLERLYYSIVKSTSMNK